MMNRDALLTAVRGPSLVDRIGDTPMTPVTGLEGVPDGVDVLGKVEAMNPGGSVKDRAAWGIVREALDSGALGRGRVLLDATSGNTGIAYGWIGAQLGIPVELCLPANANHERRRLLEALGVELMLTDPLSGTDAAIVTARRLAVEHPERYFYADQYSNPANWRAHHATTAAEIWRQTEGRVTHLVAGIGTSGTLVGTSRRLRELSRDVRVIAVQPDSPLHVMEGMKHLPSCTVPPIYDAASHDTTETVTSEAAIDMVMRQARRGLLIGWSAGAALVAAERVARSLEHGVVVAILPDGAERYLSDPLWESAR